MKLHTIYITKACNMNCAYCYERAKTNDNMKIGHLYKILSDIYDNSSEPICIEVIGGEPLLNWPVFEEICNHNANKNSMIITTTNGTLLTNDKMAFLKKSNVLVGISYDGKSTHDLYRKDINGCGTEQRVKESILTALSMGLNIVVNVAFQRGNASYIYNDIIELAKSGVKAFKIHTVNNNLFKADRGLRYFIFNKLLKMAAARKIDIDLNLDIQGSIYDHYYYTDSMTKCVRRDSLGTWEAVGWNADV